MGPGAQGPMGPMGRWGPAGGWAGGPIPVWGSCCFMGIHFQESDLSFEENLNFVASVKAPDLAWFPEVIKQTLPYAKRYMGQDSMLYFCLFDAEDVLSVAFFVVSGTVFGGAVFGALFSVVCVLAFAGMFNTTA